MSMHPKSRNLLSRWRSAGLALAIAALCAPAPAFAGAVTQPNGGTHPVTQPLLVKWNGVTGPVNFEMTVTSPVTTITLPWGQNIANTGQYTFTSAFLRAQVCKPALSQAMALSASLLTYNSAGVPVSQMDFHLYVRSTTSSNNYALSAPFKFKCPPKLDTVHADQGSLGSNVVLPDTEHPGTSDTGSLSVIKTVVNDASIPPPDINFGINVDCTPKGPKTSLKLGSFNGYHDLVTGIAPGSSCTITEQPPLVPPELARRGCKWVTEYPDGQRVTMPKRGDARARVVNHWVCKPGSETKAGTLTIIKKIVIDAPIPPPSTSFTVDVSCTLNGPNTSVALSSANAYQQIVSGIPGGSLCNVVEQPPVVPPDLVRRGCGWQTDYTSPKGGAGVVNITRVVTNRWTCKPQSKPESKPETSGDENFAPPRKTDNPPDEPKKPKAL